MDGTSHLTKDVLIEAGFQDVTPQDIAVVQHVAAVISHRAGILVGATTSVILNRIRKLDVTIAIDGSVYKNHPRMAEWLNRIINKLKSDEKTVSFLKKTRLFESLSKIFWFFKNFEISDFRIFSQNLQNFHLFVVLF